MRELLSIVLLATLVSCSNDTRNTYKTFKKFPKEINLSHEEIRIPPVSSFVVEMILTDNYLIALDLKADTFFHVYKVPSFNYLGGFIPKGKGPGKEILINPYFKNIMGNKFQYQTMNEIKIASFNNDCTEIRILEEIALPAELADIDHVFMLNDQLYGLKTIGKSKKEFVGYNPKNKSIFEYGPSFPHLNEKVPDQRYPIFAKVIVVKPDKSLFASVYDKFPILRIYKSKDGSLKKEVRLENNQRFPFGLIRNNPSEADIDSLMQNYRKIKATDRYIYALYIGKKMDNDITEMDDFSNEIHVWDWEGNPIMKITLDKKIFSFCISPDDKYLICSSINDLNKMYKYTI